MPGILLAETSSSLWDNGTVLTGLKPDNLLLNYKEVTSPVMVEAQQQETLLFQHPFAVLKASVVRNQNWAGLA